MIRGNKFEMFKLKNKERNIEFLMSIYNKLIKKGYTPTYYDYHNDILINKPDMEEMILENQREDYTVCFKFIDYKIFDDIYLKLYKNKCEELDPFNKNNFLDCIIMTCSNQDYIERFYINIKFRKGSLSMYLAEKQQQELLSIISEEPLETKKRGRL